jgi:hypothetical protein
VTQPLCRLHGPSVQKSLFDNDDSAFRRFCEQISEVANALPGMAWSPLFAPS